MSTAAVRMQRHRSWVDRVGPRESWTARSEQLGWDGASPTSGTKGMDAAMLGGPRQSHSACRHNLPGVQDDFVPFMA